MKQTDKPLPAKTDEKLPFPDRRREKRGLFDAAAAAELMKLGTVVSIEIRNPVEHPKRRKTD